MGTLTGTGSLLLAAATLAAGPTPDPAEVSARLDGLLEARWKQENITPAAAADEATFLRRVWLDLAGQVPPALAARDYLDDPRSDKRRRLVEQLLASEEFADHWGRAWAERLTGGRRAVPQGEYDGRVLHEYLRKSLAAGRSYRDVVRELVTGEGLQDSSGPVNFLLRYDAKPAELAGAVGRQLMGTTLHCAQCHDHVFAKWKKGEFWALAAFFARTKKLNAEDGDLKGVLEARKGELELPDPKGKPDAEGKTPMKAVPPRAPGAAPVAAAGSRRAALAAWLTADGNPYLARHAVNQAWAQLFGKPLVKSLDDPSAAAKGPGGGVLELLADDFRAGGYDLRRLARVLVLSRAYQLGSAAGAAATPEEADAAVRQLAAHARFPVRQLSTDQLYRSIGQATGIGGDPAADAEGDDPPKEGEGDKPAEALGEHALTVQRSLVLQNGGFAHEAVKAGANGALAVHGRRVGAGHVEWLFLATLSRRPSDDEAAAMADVLREGKGRRGLEDVVWALLNSAEFTTNH
jgi:hypothetical protein